MTTERDPEQPVGPPEATTPPAAPASPAPATPPPASPPLDDSPTQSWQPPVYNPTSATLDGSARRPGPVEASAIATSSGRRGSAARWGAALLVTALIVIAGVVAFVLMSGATSPSTLLGHVPDENSVVYAELRLDLPGDQRQKLGEFLSKFPGFQDQSTLDAKLDDVMDRIIRSMSDGSQDWTTKIKPWFDGEVGVVLGELPEVSGATGIPPGALLLASVKDEAKARAWLEEVLQGSTSTSADYSGTSLTYFGEGDARTAVGIVGGKILVAGDEASVEASIDVKGGGNFADNERFKAARASLTGDGLGYVYVDLADYVAWITRVSEDMGAGNPFQFSPVDPAMLPAWAIARFRVEGDALVFETATPHVETPLEVSNRASRIAPHLPPSTIAFFDTHDLGKYIVALIEQAREDPATAEQLAEIEQQLVGFGGLNGMVSWIDDLGFAMTRTGTTVDGGLVISSQDPAKADQLLVTIANAASLFGGQAGLSVELREEEHGDTTINIIDFGDWRDLAEIGGGSAEEMPFTGRLELAYATTDDLVVLGLGTSFVKAVLDAGPGASLADDARYKGLIDRVGAENAGAFFVDMRATREIFEQLATQMGSTDLATYEREIKPYLLPFDAFVMAPAIGGDLDRTKGIIVVK
jgi:hypothetical protein